MTRLLGVDLGERRIGLAIAESDAPAQPHATIRRGRDLDSDLRALRRVIESARVDEVVVGLPIDMSGGEGEQARRTRAWAEAVAAGLAMPVCLRDERLTSHLAESRIGSMPRGRSGGPPTPVQRERHRERIDREAASIILQDELDARAAGQPGERVLPSGVRP